jgi:hypothetical protein
LRDFRCNELQTGQRAADADRPHRLGTFVPNNTVMIHDDAVALMARVMRERSIRHTTSECTLRGFTCARGQSGPWSGVRSKAGKRTHQAPLQNDDNDSELSRGGWLAADTA